MDMPFVTLALMGQMRLPATGLFEGFGAQILSETLHNIIRLLIGLMHQAYAGAWLTLSVTVVALQISQTAVNTVTACTSPVSGCGDVGNLKLYVEGVTGHWQVLLSSSVL